MKKRFYAFYAKLLSLTLVLLGFSSCDGDEDEPDPIICEYGVPSALYKVKGTVVSAETQEPVKNIRAVMVEIRDGKEYSYFGDTVFSDEAGKFTLKLHAFPLSKVEFNIKIDDTTDKETGSYESKIETVEFEEPGFINGEGIWYKGETEKDIDKIGLTVKSDEK